MRWHMRRNHISSFGETEVNLNWRERQFSRLLAAEVCASAVVVLDTPYSEVVWRVLATHVIRQFPLHFPSRVSPCAITFQLESTCGLTEGSDEANRWFPRLCERAWGVSFYLSENSVTLLRQHVVVVVVLTNTGYLTRESYQTHTKC